MLHKEIHDYLVQKGNPQIAKKSSGYFKTGPGEYGEGDSFIGIRMPVIRDAIKKYKAADLATAQALLISKHHEIRLFSVLLMVSLFKKSNGSEQVEIYHAYLANTQYINNWDLVDSSAHYIVGQHLLNEGLKDKALFNKGKGILYKLVNSASLWERRIAVLASFQFIRNEELGISIEIYEALLGDNEDLIHKAVGWMLRELGKRDRARLEQFLKKHLNEMPRTMLRYAIEKFSKEERLRYLTGNI